MNIKTTREDILKRQEEYQKDFDIKKARYDAQYDSYRNAERAITDNIKNEIENYLSEVCLQYINIRVERSLYSSGNGKGVQVEIQSDENRVHAEDKALSWTWSAHCDENGNITKKSSSWSGLQAITKTQIESLRQTLRALEILNDIGWKDILYVELPKWSEYITEQDPSYDRNKPDFKRELFEFDLNETIGKNILVKGFDQNNNRHVMWYLISHETPKQYVVSTYYDNSIKDLKAEELAKYIEGRKYEERITKDKLMAVLNKPIESMVV